MAYFKLDAPGRLISYRLDYHSHFSGILPVRRKSKDKEEDKYKEDRSLVGLIRATDPSVNDDPARAELVLFDYALRFMMDPGNDPFAKLLTNPNRAQYERAECAAENIYMASVLLGSPAGRAAGHADRNRGELLAQHGRSDQVRKGGISLRAGNRGLQVVRLRRDAAAYPCAAVTARRTVLTAHQHSPPDSPNRAHDSTLRSRLLLAIATTGRER